jgi:hypothetical protein
MIGEAPRSGPAEASPSRMLSETLQSVVARLHRADRIVLVLLSAAIFALVLLLVREGCAGGLNRIELQGVKAAAITLGLVQAWLSFRLVVAITLWAARLETGAGRLPWTLPIWWLGALPTGWLGLVFPGHEHHPGFLALSLLMIAASASALVRSAHDVEGPLPPAGA